MEPYVTPDIDLLLKSPSAVCVRVYSHGRVCCHTPSAFVCVCAPGFRRRGADLWPAAIFCGLSVTTTAATSSRCGESFSAAICWTEGCTGVRCCSFQDTGDSNSNSKDNHFAGKWPWHFRGHLQAMAQKHLLISANVDQIWQLSNKVFHLNTAVYLKKVPFDDNCSDAWTWHHHLDKKLIFSSLSFIDLIRIWKQDISCNSFAHRIVQNQKTAVRKKSINKLAKETPKIWKTSQTLLTGFWSSHGVFYDLSLFTIILIYPYRATTQMCNLKTLAYGVTWPVYFPFSPFPFHSSQPLLTANQ